MAIKNINNNKEKYLKIAKNAKKRVNKVDRELINNYIINCLKINAKLGIK